MLQASRSKGSRFAAGANRSATSRRTRSCSTIRFAGTCSGRGLETLVGERGTLISGGERKRIALARALLRRPSLLLLDEATNAIDVEGERAILMALRDAPGRPTIVMIAHREASLSLCERLIQFSHGRATAA